MTTAPYQAIINAMHSAGVTPPQDPIEIDGDLHRYDTKKRGDKAGWYCFHPDPIAGAFGDWRQGITHQFVNRETKIIPDISALVEQAKRERIKAKRAEQKAAANRAGVLWRELKPMIGRDTDYLNGKDIDHHGSRQDRHSNTVVPVYVKGALSSLQYIKPYGKKMFLKGGCTKGGYYRIGEPTSTILIAEGFATGATLHEDTGHCVYISFNAGNLPTVAHYVASVHPEAEIVICGDNDHATDGNPGKTAAIKAAQAIGAKWIIPDFTGLDYGPKDTDFNDLKRLKAGGK